MMECIRIGMSNYNSPMNLAAKASAGLVRRDARAEDGYAMAALLVGLAVMAVFLSVAMPTWSHMIRRDKEEELVFRGTQYARAINQYQRKFANASPATLDVLIEQHFLRKKFRDPLSPNKDGEFQMLYLNTQGAASRGRGIGPAPVPVRVPAVPALSRQRRSALRRLEASSAWQARTRGRRSWSTKGSPATTSGNSWEWSSRRRLALAAQVDARDLSAVDAADETAAVGMGASVAKAWEDRSTAAALAMAASAAEEARTAPAGEREEVRHPNADITASCSSGRTC